MDYQDPMNREGQKKYETILSWITLILIVPLLMYGCVMAY